MLLLHLESCNFLFYRLTSESRRPLQIVQNVEAHVLTQSQNYEHIFLCIFYKIILFTFKSLTGLAPQSPALLCPIMQALIVGCWSPDHSKVWVDHNKWSIIQCCYPDSLQLFSSRPTIKAQLKTYIFT